ncbi:MAG: hypothetical protein NZM35_00110 [Chitinophagales bacterium]|nr:hypothetical protein [Chitinophagales bacterium]MDW8417850.1 hypothetical protein [Chitinophagales bacterium]
MTQTIRIGGVTEHFNLPWNLAIENKLFERKGVNVAWHYFPGGTGAMTTALGDGTLDVAILLTEGFLTAALKGLRARIVKEYITSPLGWGIFTGYHSPISSVYAKTQKRYAISKRGSGSHLMALIHARQRGEHISPEQWIEVKSLEGAVESLSRQETNVFYWEKYTTKPFVINGQLRMIGEFSAPWSSFLIVATEEILQNARKEITMMLDIINEVSRSFVSDPSSINFLKVRFGMSEQDAHDWLRATVWSDDYTLRRQGLENALYALKSAGISAGDFHIESYCDSMVRLI